MGNNSNTRKRAGELKNERHILAIAKDITERKRMEELMLKSKQQYDNLVSNIPVGVYILHTKPDGTFALDYVSPVMAEMLETTVESLISRGDAIFKSIHPEDLEGFVRLNQEGIQQKRPFDWKGRAVIRGVVKWLHIASIPQEIENGDYIWNGIIVDITEQIMDKAEIEYQNKNLRQINNEKDKFFSIIAHDLKTPFTGILGFSQMMIEHLKEKNYEQVGKYAEIILKSSSRAMDLLLNLMEWAQSHVGRMEFNPEYFKIIDLIEDVEALFDSIAKQKSIVIAISSPLHSSIYADKAMISSVFRNLISNAIKFTKPGGKIIISVVENPGETVVGVSDNGIGISPHNLQRLFRIDENYSTYGTQNEKGTGLGMILCKEFIEKHGGNIWVESTENAGSSFFFTLPAHQVKSNNSTVNDSEKDPGGGVRSEVAKKGLKVLIADDDEISGFLLSKLVQTSCREILIAKDGLEAVDQHRAHSDIDLILMDIKMPKMDGFEATRQIRKSDNKVIIFAQTSFSSSSDKDSSIEAGCNEHISKPVSREVLMELINKYCST